MKPCGHVTCKTCTDTLVTPSKQCIVCDAKLGEKDIIELTNLFGVYYQIRDDYLDLLVGGPLEKTKGLANDLEEGKYSFLLVMAFGSYSESSSTEDLKKIFGEF